MTNQPDPREALDAIASARQAVPGEMKYSFVYDLMYGAVCGLLVAGQGLPTPWSALVLVASMLGLVLMINWWKQKYGWWVSGYSPKRARWAAIGLAVVLIGLMGVSIWGKAAGISWTPLATGAAGFVAAIVGGRVWMAIWKRELAEAAE